MADFVTRTEIKNTLLTSLKAVLAKREADIKLMAEKEARGMAKLEKSTVNDFSYGRPTKGKMLPGYDGTKDSKTATLFGGEPKVLHPSDKKVKKNELCNDNGVLPDLGKQDISEVAPQNQAQGTPMAMSEGKQICIGCTSSNVEPLGVHRGHEHYICKDCGEVGATPREENQAAEMKKEEIEKETPPGEEKLVHKLKDEYGEDKKGKEKAYATAWEIHNRSIRNKGKKDSKEDKVEKREIANVESARQAVGVAGSGPKVASVNKPTVSNTTATKPIKDAFNTGGKPNPMPMGKAEKTPFNDGAGTTGKPHKVIPGSDVAVDAARPNTIPPAAGKEIDAKGSGGDIKKTKLAKDEQLQTKQPTPGIIPTAREQGNAKKGVTSLATIRQKWHGAGKMDANDIASKLKPVLQNLPHLHASIDKLASVLGEGGKGGVPKGPITSVGRNQYRVGSNPAAPGSFKQVDQKAQAMGKAEGIPAAPKPPGAKAASGVPAKAPAVAGGTPTIKAPSKL
jgi:hypothetical protein